MWWTISDSILRPNVFAREIPLSVDTKFIEQNSGILEQWLDRVLPPDTIRADERHFERRFGLRYAEPQLLLRFLDPELQRSAGSPWRECSLSLHVLAESSIEATTVFIVENKVNLLTLPAVPSAIAMGGLGNGIVDLAYVKWLSNRSLWYWGDLDVEGFEILSRLRIRFPQTRSFLMDDMTLLQWKDSLAISGNARPRKGARTVDRAGNDGLQLLCYPQRADRTGTHSSGRHCGGCEQTHPDKSDPRIAMTGHRFLFQAVQVILHLSLCFPEQLPVAGGC